MQYISPTSHVQITGSRNNTIKCNQKKRKETIEWLGYIVNKSKLKKQVWLLFLIRDITKLYFLTITFPQGTNDTTAHWLLNTFLTNMKSKGYFRGYLWVSERQKNGTIHFHFFITQPTPALVIRKAIRSALTTAYKKGISTYPPHECAKYTGFFFSKDKQGRVKNLKNTKSVERKMIANYCAKYITKSEQNTDEYPICHRRSGASASISKLEMRRELILNDLQEVHKYVILPARRQGLEFIERGYTIHIITETPPPEFSAFWDYISCQEAIYSIHKANPRAKNYSLTTRKEII